MTVPRRLSLAGMLLPDAEASKVQVAGRRRAPLEPVHWLGASGEPSYQNGWGTATNGQTVGFQKASDGFVRLFGSAGNTSAPGGLHTLFTLPVNYRPFSSVVFWLFEFYRTIDSFGNRISPYQEPYVLVSPDGQVRVEVAGASSYLTLDGKRFQAAN